jgi:hypothetical protein
MSLLSKLNERIQLKIESVTEHDKYCELDESNQRQKSDPSYYPDREPICYCWVHLENSILGTADVRIVLLFLVKFIVCIPIKLKPK